MDRSGIGRDPNRDRGGRRPLFGRCQVGAGAASHSRRAGPSVDPLERLWRRAWRQATSLPRVARAWSLFSSSAAQATTTSCCDAPGTLVGSRTRHGCRQANTLRILRGPIWQLFRKCRKIEPKRLEIEAAEGPADGSSRIRFCCCDAVEMPAYF